MKFKPEGTTMVTSSQYVNDERKGYSLYVMRGRALPAITDGLKAAGRRVLWTARDGKHYKCATLAGATMPIHPHATPEGTIDTLTMPFANNIPLFAGSGVFGTLLEPTETGASRYTSVEVSKFTQDVVFRDIDIIPMMKNYDQTLDEPVHFLPLVPVCLINPTSGQAIGFATEILPRSLSDIINVQIKWLQHNTRVGISVPIPYFTPLDNGSYKQEEINNKIAYYFKGVIERVNTTTVKITKIPYGQSHSNVTKKINDLYQSDIVLNWIDNSKNVIQIEVKFKRGYLADKTDDQLLTSLGLIVRHIENPNVINFSGQSVRSISQSPIVDIITDFTDWRLTWYVMRFEKLKNDANHNLRRYLDVQIAIKNDIGRIAKQTESRSELKEVLEGLGVEHLDYVADLPVYRFSVEENNKNEQKIIEMTQLISQYDKMLSSQEERRKLYVIELQEILSNFNKGMYTK